MKKFSKIMALALVAVMALQLTACGILPTEEKNPSGAPQMSVEEQKAIAQKNYIEKYKMTYLVDFLMHLEPILSEEEMAALDAEKRQQMPFRIPTPDLINYCTTHSNFLVQDFLSDFGTGKYDSLTSPHALKKIYNGRTDLEINGGTVPKVIGNDTGYWRITDCTYYNQAFFTDEETNTVRILYRCNMYHYVLKNSQNLADTPINPDAMTTENTDIKEYENSFLVVSINNVRPMDIRSSKDVVPPELQPEVLMFMDYESAIQSFEKPEHTFKNLYIPKTYSGTIVDGYVGKPLVTMPEIVGQLVDVSTPKNIQSLDEMGITNYKVKWVPNTDGSLVPYSILSSSVAPGTIVDITDKDSRKTIIVEVAEKQPTDLQQQVITPVDNTPPEEEKPSESSDDSSKATEAASSEAPKNE